MSSQPVKGVIRHVKPLLSVDELDARRRVIALYKAWYRFMPTAVINYVLPVPASLLRRKLKEAFMKHKDVRDIRVIDMLVIEGRQELEEFRRRWKQNCHVMSMLKDTHNPRPKTFLTKFLSGSD